MDSTDLCKLIERVSRLPEGVAASDSDSAMLMEALRQYSYATLPAVVLLRHLPEDIDADSLQELQQRVALFSASERTVAYARYGKDWAQFYPSEHTEDTPQTEDVIDTFLRTYGNCSPEEERLLEQMIFNPTPDYAEMLARQEQDELPREDDSTNDDEQFSRINAFIRERHPASHSNTQAEEMPEADKNEEHHASRPENTDDTLLSESLAKIFIKQGRYERAFEIISGLNLKFPKKSAYFADQLRFLRKLIINQQRLRDIDAGDNAQK